LMVHALRFWRSYWYKPPGISWLVPGISRGSVLRRLIPASIKQAFVACKNILRFIGMLVDNSFF
jgi:hypothetical protein